MFPNASQNGHVTAPVQIVPVQVAPQQQQMTQQQPVMMPVMQQPVYQQPQQFQQWGQVPVQQPVYQQPQQFQQQYGPAPATIPANFTLTPLTGHQQPVQQQLQQPGQQQQQQAHPLANEYTYLAQVYRKSPDEVRQIIGEDPLMVQAVMSQVNENMARARQQGLPPQLQQQGGQQQQQAPASQPIAFNQTYPMPAGWQSVLRQNRQTGQWEPSQPQYGQLAAMQNHNEQVAAARVNQFAQNPVEFLSQDQQVAKYIEDRIQAGVQQHYDARQTDQTLQSFAQTNQHELVLIDPSTGRAMVDPAGNVLATPVGNAFRARAANWRAAGMKVSQQMLTDAFLLAKMDIQRAQMQQQQQQLQQGGGQLPQQYQTTGFQQQPPQLQTMNLSPQFQQGQQQPQQWNQPNFGMAPLQGGFIPQQQQQQQPNDIQAIVNMNRQWNTQYPGANGVQRQAGGQQQEMTFDQAFHEAVKDMPDGLGADKYAERVFGSSMVGMGGLFG